MANLDLFKLVGRGGGGVHGDYIQTSVRNDLSAFRVSGPKHQTSLLAHNWRSPTVEGPRRCGHRLPEG
jgi:hypothetical protein